MYVLPSLIPLSCTHWANIERLFFGGSDTVYLRGGGGHVKAVSGRCLTGNIWTQQLTVAIPNDFALCLPGAGAQDLFPDADYEISFLCQQGLHRCGIEGHLNKRTEDRKNLGRRVDAHWQP
jgi:hypothetical protein